MLVILTRVIARVAKVFGVNSTCKAINSTQLRLILFQLALLMLLVLNTFATRAITLRILVYFKYFLNSCIGN